MFYGSDKMFFKSTSRGINRDTKTENSAMQEFKRLWNDELIKKVDSRDFSKAYNYASRKHQIRDVCMRTYFDFSSENSIRFKEACDAFDEGDILWTYMLIRQFASVSGLSASLKHITNKRRAFLSEKRKESIITRHSIRMYIHNLMQTPSSACESFIKSAINDMEQYQQLKKENKYKSAYKLAVLTDKSGDYPHNIKKNLYYAAKRPITEENLEETNKYFDYVCRYYTFKRKKKDGGYVYVDDIDVIVALLVFMKNGGNVSKDEFIERMHRTVKVYCMESVFAPICLFADYLYQIGEPELEQIVLKLLVNYGEAISEKYKKRYTCLELISKNSSKFIFRHKPHSPIECVTYNHDTEKFSNVLEKCITEKEKNSWCIVIKSHFKSYEFSYRYFYDDRLLSTIENILDNEFGEYVLEYSMRTFFSGDDKENAKHSMIIITSGKNQYADFPKIAMMVKIEPITKKYVNLHYCTLYLPEEEYTAEEILQDAQYVENILKDSSGSRFTTFSKVVEDIVWKTVEDLIGK